MAEQRYLHFSCRRAIGGRCNNRSPRCCSEVGKRCSTKTSVISVLTKGALKWPIWRSQLAFLGRSLKEKTVQKLKIEEAFPNLVSNPVAQSCPRPKSEALFLLRLFVSSLIPVTFHGLERSCGCRIGSNRKAMAGRWRRFPSNWIGHLSRASWTSLSSSSPSDSLWLSFPFLTWTSMWVWQICQKETAFHAFYYCERINPFWSHIVPKQLILLDVDYAVDNVLPPCSVSRDSSLSQNGILDDAEIWIIWLSKFFWSSSIFFFFRKCSDHKTFDKFWCMQQAWS